MTKNKYNKLITLSIVLVLLIALITLAMIYEVDFVLFKNLSIAGIQEKKMSVETLMQKQTQEEQNNSNAKSTLQKSKNSFDVAKQEYENIDESTITIVQEATKEVKYFIEYLWIVLGNYANANGVDIAIITPGSTVVQSTDSTTNTNAGNTADTNAEASGSLSPLTSGVKISVKGRYANVADFVFDVENDKSLKFKLDNIKMTYSGNNQITATFDVLSLSVLK